MLRIKLEKYINILGWVGDRLVYDYETEKMELQYYKPEWKRYVPEWCSKMEKKLFMIGDVTYLRFWNKDVEITLVLDGRWELINVRSRLINRTLDEARVEKLKIS